MVGNKLEGFGYYATTVVPIMITLLEHTPRLSCIYRHHR